MKKKVLFLCTGNSCRSQMAEGWARALFSGTWEAFSAGTLPVAIDPLAVAVMEESGVDIAGQASKSVRDFAGREFDLVVTVCDAARETCPVFPGTGRRIHRSFDDPPAAAGAWSRREEKLHVYRRVRDELRSFVQDVLGGGPKADP